MHFFDVLSFCFVALGLISLLRPPAVVAARVVAGVARELDVPLSLRRPLI